MNFLIWRYGRWTPLVEAWTLNFVFEFGPPWHTQGFSWRTGMMPEEQAAKVYNEILDDEREPREIIADAIREAVAAEREACAKIAEDNRFFRHLYDDHIENSGIAEAIRARGGQASVFAGEPPECLTHECPPLVAHHQGRWEEGLGWQLDRDKCAGLKFIALARNAFDAMTRRELGVREVGDEAGSWVAFLSKDGNIDLTHNFPRCPDPFTAIVEADRWYRENVEKI